MEKYFIPDYVNSISLIPIVYFKCSRPGKSVPIKFAPRFIDSYGYGILIRPELSDSINSHREFISNALDFTSVIPLDTFSMEQYYDSFFREHPFSIKVNGEEVFQDLANPSKAEIYETIFRLTSYCATRVGDFIAFELANSLTVKKGENITANIPKQIISFLVQ